MAYVFAQFESEGILTPDPAHTEALYCEPWPCSSKRNCASSVCNSGVYPYWRATTYWTYIAGTLLIAGSRKPHPLGPSIDLVGPVEFQTGYWIRWSSSAPPTVVVNGGDDYYDKPL